MADDFYPFVDSGDPAPDNSHITGIHDEGEDLESTVFATRIAVYDDMLSTPHVSIIQPKDPRTYLEEVTNEVYRRMKDQGGSISLMVIRELVENFIHAHFAEPIVSILDDGNTIRFADQGPGISDKERAFEFGVTSANRSMKRYIRGTGAGLPMVQQYLENAGGAVSIEDNLGSGTVVTVSIDPARVAEIEGNTERGAAVRGTQFTSARHGTDFPKAGVPGTAMPPAPFGTVPGAGGMPDQGAVVCPIPQASGVEGPAPMPGAAQPYAVPAYQAHQQYAQPYGYPQAIQPGMWPGAYPAYGYPQQAMQGQPPAASTYAGMHPQPMNPGMPQGAGYPSTPVPSAGAYSMQAPGQGLVPGAGMAPILPERSQLALGFLAQHGQAGPAELTEAFGHSGPTWSRELGTLSTYGFAVKQGRKYLITQQGADWIAQHTAQA